MTPKRRRGRTNDSVASRHMIINFGSINIDHVYRVRRLVKPGETIAAKAYEKFLGGKGVNQSIAIAQASGSVKHIGAVGEDGDWALLHIEAFGVETTDIKKLSGASGHAVIMVDDQGENQILVESATNHRLTEAQIDEALAAGDPSQDWVLLQNETNLADLIVTKAKQAGFKIAYAAAPFVAETTIELIPFIDLLAVNEGEADALSKALNRSLDGIDVPMILVTHGAKGATLHQDGHAIHQAAFSVETFDTVGAGDTFLGSFLSELSLGKKANMALQYAAAASAIQVTRPGAAAAIPTRAEVEEFLTQRNAS